MKFSHTRINTDTTFPEMFNLSVKKILSDSLCSPIIWVIVGVVQLARPVSRMLDNGKTIEVVRLCTDGTPNVCSFLYSRAARMAQEMGYSKIITYILDSESGVSLKASGWHKEADTHGHNWSCKTRPRNTTDCRTLLYLRAVSTRHLFW